MNTEKDYSKRGWLAIGVLIVVLIGLSFIPPQIIGGVSFRRANIFSDLLRFDDASIAPSQVMLDEEEYHVDMEEVSKQIAADETLPNTTQTTFKWTFGSTPKLRTLAPDSIRFKYKEQSNVVSIEDFSSENRNQMNAMYEKMAQGQPVRIAVMGDSFIEGDILTADLRERLQECYGGSGAGFVPMASPLTGFRRTVKTQSRGWSSYNIMQHRSTPASLRENYYISGWVCQPSAGAQTRWDCTSARKYLDPCTEAHILFISHRNSKTEVIINDTVRQTFTVEGDPALRQIAISGLPIRSLSFRVAEGADDFIGYGAILGSDGVSVDNYSIRSNNGQAMFHTNPTINSQANEMLKYDLVILQYGLNIMQKGIRNYANYGAQMRKMINYVRQCFPSAAILVMGVSDRACRTETGVVPMDAVPYMAQCQRKAASDEGVSFWDTATAMRNMGGMTYFVSNGWAGKDYTHINYTGGRHIAHALHAAIHEKVSSAAQESRQRRIRQSMGQIVTDSLRQEMRQQLLPPTIIKVAHE